MQTTKSIFRKGLRWLEHIHLVHWIWERTHDIQIWQWGIMVLTAITTTIVGHIRDASPSTIGLWAVGLVIVVFVIVIAFQYKAYTKPSVKHIPVQTATDEATITSPTAPALPVILPPVPKPTKHAGEIIVDVTPQYLAGFYKEHTAIQADRLAAAYIGKWIRVSGPLDEVYPFQLGGAQVTFHSSTFGPDYLVVFMYFSEKWIARLSVLTRGVRLTVLGRIQRANVIEVHLGECELEDS